MKDLEHYLETYAEIAYAIGAALADDEMDSKYKFVAEIYEETGRGGIWNYTRQLADEFEELHKDTEWDGEFFDEIDLFLTTRL